jgi:hypothetical protein
MRARSRDGSHEPRTAPQLIGGCFDRAVEDLGVKDYDVIGVQLQQREFAPLVAHASAGGVATVMACENRERLPMLGDETLSPAANEVAQLVCTHQVKAAILQLLNKD